MAATTTIGSTLACPPRYGTPRNPDRPTLGGQVGDVARRLGLAPMPWQQHLLDVAFELDADGELHYSEVHFLAPRQNGKTAITVPVAVHRLSMLARAWGPQSLTYTAQTRTKARAKLEREFAEILRGSRSFTELTNPKARPKKATEWKLGLNNGSEHIRLGRSWWNIDAPSRTGTHGDHLDVGMIDEAFAHRDDAVETAMTPAQATRRCPQLWVFSTAGDSTSFYLWRKVLAGRAACERGEHGRVAYFEWSAPDELDPADPATWRVAMPALGFTITERFIAAKWEAAVRKGPEGVASFRRSFLNQWPAIPVLDDIVADAVFKPGVWAAVCAPTVAQPGAGLVLAVDTNPERTRTAIAVAGGGGTAGLIAERDGTGWALPELVRIARDRDAPVAVAANGPASSMILPLEQAGVTVWPVSSRDMATACAWFHDTVVESAAAAATNAPRALTVKRHDALDAAVADLTKKGTGDTFVWDRRAGTVCSVVALTLATWKALTAPADDAGEANLW